VQKKLVNWSNVWKRGNRASAGYLESTYRENTERRRALSRHLQINCRALAEQTQVSTLHLQSNVATILVYMVRTLSEKEKAIESLSALAENINEKTEAAKLREVFEYIEMTLSSGVSREKVLETLRTTLGIKMNLKTFENNLYRIRKKQKKAKLVGIAKTKGEISSGSKQLIAVSNIITKPAVTDTEKSKKFISPGDIKKARLKVWEEEKSFEDNYNYDNEEK
jgi:hypothetical protein